MSEKELHFKGGSAAASSEILPNYPASSAFLTDGKGAVWATGPHGKPEKLPAHIWYDFGVGGAAACPSRVSFSTGGGVNNDPIQNALAQSPTQFEFIGVDVNGMDEIGTVAADSAANGAANNGSAATGVGCSATTNWEVLCADLSGVPFKSLDEIRACRVNIESKADCRRFRCLGIRVLANNGGHHARLGGIKMWGFQLE